MWRYHWLVVVGCQIYMASCTSSHIHFLPKCLTLYTLTSVCIFSLLFFIHFLKCWHGEFKLLRKVIISLTLMFHQGWYCKQKLDSYNCQGSKAVQLKSQLVHFKISTSCHFPTALNKLSCMSTYAKVGGWGRGWLEPRRTGPGEARKGWEAGSTRGKPRQKLKNFKAIICCIFTAYHSTKNL